MMRFLYFFVFVLFLTSCNDEPKEVIPNIDHIQVDFDVIRFDQEVMNNDVDALMDKYPAFAETFFNHIIPVKREQNYQAVFDTIRSQDEFNSLVDTCQLIFQNFDDTRDQLELAFRYMNYYIPEIDVPDIYTIVSGFAYQRFILEDKEKNNLVGLGLDMFMGESFPYGAIAVDNPAFSNYLTRSFNKEHLPKKVVELLLEDYIPKPKSTQMLDQMLYNGKKLYLLNKILPEVSDTIVMEYTADQWEWIQENEMEIWAYFLKEKLFYKSNTQEIGKYINPSPHSPGMPPSAPGRTGNYMGWQIIERFVQKHPEMSIQELIDYDDAQKLLQASRYKPKR